MHISHMIFSPLRSKGFYVKFNFLTVLNLKTAVLWYVTTCNSVQSTVPDEPDLKLQAANSFEALVSIYKATWRLIPEENNVQIPRNLL
jgi:hypothetical protein